MVTSANKLEINNQKVLHSPANTQRNYIPQTPLEYVKKSGRILLICASNYITFMALGASTSGAAANEPELPLLSEQITLEELWDTLGECLSELGRTSDSHAVLVLQPAVEAFFLVHGTEKQVIVSLMFYTEGGGRGR